MGKNDRATNDSNITDSGAWGEVGVCDHSATYSPIVDFCLFPHATSSTPAISDS